MTAPDGPLVFDAAAVAGRLDYPALIDRLDAAFRAPAEVPLRHRHAMPGVGGDDKGAGEPGGVMLIKPAWRDGGPIVVKIVNIFPENARHGLPALLGTVMVFDGRTGAPLAVIDGQALTVRRTAAASALAARHLARDDAATLLVVGTGQLAPELARAHATVRPISQVLVWGRNPVKARSLADTLAAEGLSARPADDLAAAVAGADIVSCATLATEPLVFGGWLAPGTHLDLVGSFRPDMREADDTAVARARVFVDTREGTLSETGDLIDPIASGVIAPDDICGDLAELCTDAVPGRRDAKEITLFKSVGTALEDLAAAELVIERA